MEKEIKRFKPDGVKKNLFFQFFYQVIILVIPLILAPYLTRTLGDTALGIYSYTLSIAQIFVVVANLGIAKYGQRLIVEKRDDDEKLRKSFWSLFLVHFIISTIISLCFVCFCFIPGLQDSKIYLLQSFYVVSSIFDITWLFFGLENFKSVVIKNILIKTFELILILILIKTTTDLWLYTLIMSLSSLIGMVVLLPSAIKRIKPIRFNIIDCREHIKPLLILFIASVAGFLFSFFDKTLLGLFSTKENVAYYEYSNKIILVPRTIASVISTVMYSRACFFIQHNKIEEAKKFRRYSILFIYFISFASIFGLIGVGPLFSTLYYGEEFSICGLIIMALSPTILITSLADLLRTQILIPMHKDFEYTIISLVSAILNIIISIILIPPLGVFGVVVGSLFAEGLALILQLVICRKQIDLVKSSLLTIPFMLIGLIMLVSIYFLGKAMPDSLLKLLVQVGVGGVLFFILSFVYLIFIYKEKKDIRLLFTKVKMKIFKSKEEK